jgi:hypothetical protein
VCKKYNKKRPLCAGRLTTRHGVVYGACVGTTQPHWHTFSGGVGRRGRLQESVVIRITCGRVVETCPLKHQTRRVVLGKHWQTRYFQFVRSTEMLSKVLLAPQPAPSSGVGTTIVAATSGHLSRSSSLRGTISNLLRWPTSFLVHLTATMRWGCLVLFFGVAVTFKPAAASFFGRSSTPNQQEFSNLD